MSRFLIIECDERLNPAQLPVGVPFKGTHVFAADEILRMTVTARDIGSCVVVVMKHQKGTTICHTHALPGAVMAQVNALTVAPR